MAFTFAYDLTGAAPIIRKQTVANTVVLSKGEMVNLESGELTTAVTADTALYGVTTEAVDNTDDGLECAVIVNPFAVYAVTDAIARVAGAPLDIGTGALTLASNSNSDLVVVEDSTATEPTLVTFNGSHIFNP